MINKCEECTLCCELLPIKEINKQPSVLCSDCTLSKGCNIYNNRPEECKNFNCLYIEDNEMPDFLRPDKCNVIFEKITTKIFIAINHYNEPFAYERENVIDYIKSLNEKGISVITTSFTNEPNEVFVGEGHTEEGIKRVTSNILKNRV